MKILKRTLPRVLLPALLLFAVLPANAGVIFLSGDTNIINGLDGSFGQVITPGNETFFSNILGSGTTVLVHDNCAACSGSIIAAVSVVDNFYNSLTGVSSSTVAGVLTGGALAGVDLFVSILPASAFTAAELSVLAGFGGDVLFMGENDSFTNENNRINAALSALGSSMSLLNTTFDVGFLTATGGQIAADPFTSGITSFLYAAPSQLSGGTTLFSGIAGEPFIAYESVGVPEPSTLMLFGIALLGLGWMGRRRTA